MLYKDYITEVPDFPIEGVSFKDISPLLADDKVFRKVIRKMGHLVDADFPMCYPDYWIAIDARGFIFASALSVWFGGGVVMCRKAGKLPPPIASHKYKTEYKFSSDHKSFILIQKVYDKNGVHTLTQKDRYTFIENSLTNGSN